MALDFIKQINENIHLAVWKIEEHLAFYEKNVQLSSIDQRIFEETTHSEKKLEFMAGRMLCKTVLHQLQISEEPIFRNIYGKPQISNSEYDISLSHTENYIALAIGHKLDVGIDIEKPKAKMAKVAPRLFTEEEMDYCQNNLVYFSKVWSAKEVLYKLFMKRELDFKEHMSVKPENKDWTLMNGTIKKDGFQKSYQLAFYELGEYFICLNVT
ncbi:4'-phosphopantetheinyl transferase superfamily protein [Marivirga sericea]|uniref:4'-phosphopantetheinyl transferase superfamily protein n=1 Tax=Marivirga sericea TaxID=1028 RepID=A0A1X7I478_9BACT|nr:4'-phosphopantetheinyl transferase superfamily protein [Marivirga sericea]SMG08839.1 4'-phosphopantetheinyl transferase superfamily protein [Marivirga sericea]